VHPLSLDGRGRGPRREAAWEGEGGTPRHTPRTPTLTCPLPSRERDPLLWPWWHGSGGARGVHPLSLDGRGRDPRRKAAWEGEGGSPRHTVEESHPHLSSPLKGEGPAAVAVVARGRRGGRKGVSG
jgi:hypothetical protein